MSKFNTSTVTARKGLGFIESTGETAINHGGQVGYARTPKSELFLSAVSDFVENSFYESAEDRQARVRSLVSTIVKEDPKWIASFVLWLRTEANMRSISLVIALEAAASMVALGIPGGRAIVASVLTRADEPGEALAYWTSQKGRKIPSAVKRGIADAAVKTYSQYSLSKYDSDAKGFTFADVIQLTHPKPENDVQADLFRYAMEKRFDSATPAPESLGMIEARKRYLAMDKDELRGLLKSDGGSAALKHAGLTWEAVAGTVGLDAQIWASLIPTMGYMALLRNLRNFEKEGVANSVLDGVAARLADEDEVAKSKQLPFRFLSAYKATEDSLRFGFPLEQALTHSTKNVPALKGNTLILVDRSYSMFGAVTKSTKLNLADSAAIFGTALAIRAENATLVQYGSSDAEVSFKKGSSVLKTLAQFRNLGGTDTFKTLSKFYHTGYDRVVIITDEQFTMGDTSPGFYGRQNADIIAQNTPLYVWNLGGYATGQQDNSKPNRYTFGGLSDQSFKLIPLIEAGKDASWPWEN